jgi:hypothetical protein
MATTSNDIRDPEIVRAQPERRAEPRTNVSVPGFAAWSTARWVEEQEALAAAATRRAPPARARRAPAVLAARPAARIARPVARRPGNWLLRLEAALERLLPGGFGSLLGLFLCVTLSMALISSMLPVLDRL